MIEKVLYQLSQTQSVELLNLIFDSIDALPKVEQTVAETIYKFYKKFNFIPSRDELDLLNPEWSQKYFIESSTHLEPLMEWWKAAVIRQRLSMKVREAAIALDSGNNDVEYILRDAAKLAAPAQEQKSIILSTDWKDILEFAVNSNSESSFITTGIDMLDKATGGYSRGEASAIMAPSSRGKSMWLAHNAYHSAMNGLKVLVVTLEISGERWTQRLLQRIGLNSDPVVLRDERSGIISRYVNMIDGDIKVDYMPAQSLTIGGLEVLIERTADKYFKPDMVIVDYMDEMHMQQHEHYRIALREAAQGLTHLAKQYDCHVASATQTNRDAVSKTIITEKDIGEAYGKVQVLDMLFALCATDDEVENGQARIYICKNRNRGGRGKQVPVAMDLSRAYFSDMKVTEATTQGQQNLTEEARKREVALGINWR